MRQQHGDPEAGTRQVAASPWRNNVMINLIKIVAVLAIGYAVLNPTFTPKAEDAKCSCKANT